MSGRSQNTGIEIVKTISDLTISLEKNLANIKDMLLLSMLPIIAVVQKTPVRGKNEADIFFTDAGLKVYTGQTIRIGDGTLENGDFKYITGRQNSSVHNLESKRKNSLPSNLSGLYFKIIKIDTRRDINNYQLFYPIIYWYYRYEIDIDNAITSGEIVPLTGLKPNPQSTLIKSISGSSIASRLLISKKLSQKKIWLLRVLLC